MYDVSAQGIDECMINVHSSSSYNDYMPDLTCISWTNDECRTTDTCQIQLVLAEQLIHVRSDLYQLDKHICWTTDTCRI